MFALFKSKVKVYFYHLFILALVMLCCFFLMYKDIKRIEGNVLNLRSKCNQLEQKCLENENSNLLDKDYVMLENDTDNIELTDDEINAINDNGENNDLVEVMDGSVNENVENNDENEDVENNDENVDLENNNVDNNDENDDVDNLLKEVTLSNDNDDNIDILLNEVEKIKSTEDLSKLSETELSEKTNNELKEYLRSVGKSTSGNKKELIETILN